MIMDKAIEEFEADMRMRNLSERTIETYGLYVRRFRGFLHGHYPRVTSWERVTKEIALDYQRYVAGTQMDTGELQAYVDQATIDGSFQLDKLNQLLGVFEEGDELLKPDEDDEKLSSIIAGWQQDQESEAMLPELDDSLLDLEGAESED